ncbi:MAG: hypothetical protein Q4C53_09515 [Clostridia bacterium]|nr:hypothetical protein [Clostridia bacterium]
MKKIVSLVLSLMMLVCMGGFAAAESPAQVTVGTATVDVYDFGTSKLHVFMTGDALGDVAYIVEGPEALVGIELPAFTDGLDAWKQYAESLGKPMNDLFLCDHATGASYTEGMTVYGTANAQASIASGAVFATTQGLYEVFGDAFHGGADMANINTVVSGPVTVAGIEFNVIDRGASCDIEIPGMNAVYTHMLGKTCHSILTGAEHMDATVATLKEYRDKGYAMILSSHSGVEGQDAVDEKILYVEKVKELAASNDNAEGFLSAVKAAFPDYVGENYLEMTAGYLFN